MCSRWLFLALLSAGVVDAQTPPPTPATQALPTLSPDSFPALRARYAAEVAQLMPQWKAAELAAQRADSLRASQLPSDTLRAGSMLWLTAIGRSSALPDALAHAATELQSFFGREADILSRHLFVAKARPVDGRDTSNTVVDLAEAFPGRLDIFDRVNDDESKQVIEDRILRRASRLILESGDSTVLRWLIDPFNPLPSRKGIRELMFADLITAPSQVSSRCLGGDLARCRDALGITVATDPLTEWYDPAERRLLVVRMRELLDVGPQHAAYVQCDQRRDFEVCDRILRAIPRYVAPPALPVSARHHFFRLAMKLGGRDAYSRFASGVRRPLEMRIADAAGMPIDSVVARWRDDVLSARPASPAPSVFSALTAVAWGIAVVLVALRFASWR